MAGFPSRDNDAAIRWLQDPKNRLFVEYNNIATDEAKEWEPLQELIKQITGVEGFMTLVRGVVSMQLDPDHPSRHATPDDHKAIAARATRLMYKSIQVPWVEESRGWVEKAMEAIAPRAVALWKKSVGKDGSKAGGESPPQGQTTPPVDTIKQKRKLGQEDGTNLRGKKAKIGTEHSSSLAIAPPQTPPSLLLIDRDIVVEHQPLDPKADVGRIVVAVCAIIGNEHTTLPNEDIRAQHIDCTKFQAILASEDPEIDFKRFSYDWSTANQPRIKATEEGIRYAVGLEIKDLEKGVTEGDRVRIILKANGEL